MASLFTIVIILLAAGGNAFAQSANPWDWQKDQNKYALYDGSSMPVSGASEIFLSPPAHARPIYAHNKKGYARYVSHVTSSYTKRYDLNSKQSKNLYGDLLRQYSKSGTKALYVHQALEAAFSQMLTAGQMAQWLQLRLYPEYDPYYLVLGRVGDVYNR